MATDREPTLQILVRDGMFKERKGIADWPTADTAIRSNNWATLKDLADELKANGFEVHAVATAGGTTTAGIVEVLVGVGGLDGLAAVLRTVFHRNDGKKIHFEYNDQTIDIEGISEKRLEEIIKTLSKLPDQAEQQSDAEEADRAPEQHPRG